MQHSFEYEFHRLTERQISRVLEFPETGMGFQILYQRGENENDPSLPILTNSEFIIQIQDNISTPILTNFENLSLEFEQISDFDFTNSFSQGRMNVAFNNKYTKQPPPPPGQTPPFLYVTRSGDEFRRLSAFRNDRRILDDGTLLPGTYGTTVNDLTVVPSGIAAVGRYALPNRVAACYVYQIIPPPGTLVYFGTVTPNYGLCGGGVEVFFPNGCATKSARLIGTISEI